jgi:hypothetical protein
MRDPFATDDVFTQDYVGTIRKMIFSEDQYGNMQATVTNVYDTPITGDDGEIRTERPEFYTVGGIKTWTATEGGSGFGPVDGNHDKRIRSNSGFGMLMLRIAELVGQSDLLARAPETGDANPLYRAETYLGLRFHWVTEGAGEDYKFKGRDGEEVKGKTKGRQLPVEYLPDGEQMVMPVADFDIEALALDAELLADLKTAAEGYGYNEWQKAGISMARDLQGTDAYGTLVSALSERSFYEKLRA